MITNELEGNLTSRANRREGSSHGSDSVDEKKILQEEIVDDDDGTPDMCVVLYVFVL